MYDDRRMYQLDLENALEYAEIQGETKKSFAIVAKMKNFGYSIPEIVELTSLTVEQIETL